MRVTVLLDDEEVKILEKRAKKNIMTLREQIEDIIRRSCVSSKKKKTSKIKFDDKLISAFARNKSGRPRKS
jgi:hypothetical protein